MTKKDDFLEKIFEPALRKHGLKLTSPRRLIAERIFTENSPTVEIISPNGGEKFVHGAQIDVQWVSSDIDGDELFHSVFISQDNGGTWIPISLELNEDQHSFEAPPNIDSNTLLIRACREMDVTRL